VDWVRSLWKIQLQVFCSKSRYNGPPASFAPFFRRKLKLRKRNKHEFWVKRGGLGAFVAENSTASFLFQKSLERPPGEFRTLFRRKPKLENATNMSFGSNGVDWVRSLQKIQLQVFCSKSRYNGPPGRVSHHCSVENRNSENATNMSFGSNGVDWVRSLRKIQLQVFLFQKSLKRTPGRVSHDFPSKTETLKSNKHEFWVKWGGLGAFVAENSTASFLFQKSL
jgi:hypothetical protein